MTVFSATTLARKPAGSPVVLPPPPSCRWPTPALFLLHPTNERGDRALTTQVLVRWPSRGRSPTPNATPAEVGQFLSSASDDDWSSGSGTLGVHRGGETIIVSKKRGGGYMINFLTGEMSAPGHVIVASTDFSTMTTVVVGGERWKGPEAFLVSRELVFAAVEHFFRSGGKKPDLNWTDAGLAMRS